MPRSVRRSLLAVSLLALEQHASCDSDNNVTQPPLHLNWDFEDEDALVVVPFRRPRLNDTERQRRTRLWKQQQFLLRRAENVTVGNETEISQNKTETVEAIGESSEANATEVTETNATAIPETTITTGAAPTPPALDKVERVVVDYASKSAGALILEKSHGWKGTSNLLNSNQDQYAIIPCEEPEQDVVIGLSEDILVKQITIANFERYSSHMEQFELWGSQSLHSDWNDLGRYTLLHRNGRQTFELHEFAWARYLKFRFLSHHGDEHFCTISQISVSGSTMLQGFHEQWDNDNEAEDEDDDVVAADNNVENTAVAKEVGEAKDPGDAERLDGKSMDMTQPVIDQCFTKLDAMCPADLSFEQTVFLLDNTASDFERMSVLSSASICLSSTSTAAVDEENRTTSNTTLGTKALSQPSVNQSSDGVVLCHHGSTITTRQNGMAESPMIKQLQELVKAKTGSDGSIDAKIESSRTGQAEDTQDTGKDTPRSPPKQVEAHMDTTDQEETQAVSVAQVARPSEGKAAPASNEQGADTKGKPPSSDPIHETNAALARLLEHFPSAACLGKLDFAALKAAKVKDRSHGSGQAGHSATGNPMEPIFKKLTDEIKTLQATAAVHDQFTREMTTCYQSVLLDLLMEHQVMSHSYSDRLDRIEQEIRFGLHWIAAFLVLLSSLLVIPVRLIVFALATPFVGTSSTAWRWLEMLVKLGVAIGAGGMLLCAFTGVEACLPSDGSFRWRRESQKTRARRSNLEPQRMRKTKH